MAEQKTITLWNAKLYFKNFAGAQGKWNNAGDRNFGVFLDDDTARELEEDGWNVKRTKPDEDGYERPFIKVKVNFKGRPKIYLVRSNRKVLLDEESVGEIDDLVFEKVDLKIRHAYLKNYDVWTQYLDKGFFTVLEDELDRAYSDPDPIIEPIEDDLDDIPFE